MSVCELVDPTAEPKVYKFILPNLVETVNGDMVDVGRVEHFTLEGLNEKKAALEAELDDVNEKIEAINQL